MQRLGYVPALDGLRAIAIAAVVGLHATGFPPGGGVGVSLFFVLSGFLITTLLLEEHASRGSVSLRGFYRRRAYRLVPALAVVLAVYAIVVSVNGAIGGEWPASELTATAMSAAYVMNFYVVDQGAVAHISHLWSLAAEEQFYLVWPVALFAVLRARIVLALVAVVAGISLSVAAHVRLYADGESWSRMWYGPDVTAVPILAGCLLALLYARRREAVLRFGALVGTPATLGFASLLLVSKEAHVRPGVPLLIAICAGGMIAGALSGRLARPLSTRVMVWIGVISYSLYLWHRPVIAVVDPQPGQFVVEWWSFPAIAASVVIAAASYYFVERPFLRRRYQPETAHEHHTRHGASKRLVEGIGRQSGTGKKVPVGEI